jgi:hypothetical protein
LAAFNPAFLATFDVHSRVLADTAGSTKGKAQSHRPPKSITVGLILHFGVFGTRSDCDLAGLASQKWEYVSVVSKDGVATVTINCPPINIMTGALLFEICWFLCSLDLETDETDPKSLLQTEPEK